MSIYSVDFFIDFHFRTSSMRNANLISKISRGLYALSMGRVQDPIECHASLPKTDQQQLGSLETGRRNLEASSKGLLTYPALWETVTASNLSGGMSGSRPNISPLSRPRSNIFPFFFSEFIVSKNYDRERFKFVRQTSYSQKVSLPSEKLTKVSLPSEKLIRE